MGIRTPPEKSISSRFHVICNTTYIYMYLLVVQIFHGGSRWSKVTRKQYPLSNDCIGGEPEHSQLLFSHPKYSITNTKYTLTNTKYSILNTKYTNSDTKYTNYQMIASGENWNTLSYFSLIPNTPITSTLSQIPNTSNC